ncbi:serine/threonine-protein kinase [Thioflexithrix psekupsensis]|uniref:Protein kinase domain-containing protein n=1 Tax=Thioflexithrix psekupsensis TaxID=1570016 RepID=A0A251X592_9GAMM|nr:serine/threonine-protein kinase [Thioflexithrix psekupsensis]OUD12107.1 hypothetical protein TPSD3_13345 [Thioflexithrix psekupsensis]
MNVVQQVIRQLTPESRCLNCMQDKGTAPCCPYCGYDERQHKNHPLYLKPRTLLKNQYLIGKCLGQGGFGITYTAFDGWLQKKVAIKEYLPATLATRDMVTATVIPIKKQETAFQQGLRLFIEEARHLARFDHPHIVRVIHFFEAQQTGYMVMEYLDGENLTDVLLKQDKHRLPIAHALQIILPILDALDTVHHQQLYHRDISLQNIRILKDGTPILIDFGAARHVVGENSQTLDLVLKHGYSPIEQYSGRGKIGAWTDIYACGALLYLLLTGRLPPAATDRLAGDHLLPLSQLVPDANIPAGVLDAITRALALQHTQRFQTVRQFKAALQGQPIPEELPVPVVKQTSIRWPILAMIVLGLVSSAGLFLYARYEREQQLAQWLQQAEFDWQQGRLLSPEGENAYARYQKILQRDPEHPAALSGVKQLLRYYQHQAEQAYNKQQWEQVAQAIQQELIVSPNDEILLHWQNQWQQQRDQQVTEAQKQHDRDVQLSQMLQQARQAVALSQLSEAVQLYQQLLTAYPEHVAATEGLQEIATRYETLVREHALDPAAQLFFLEEGLRWFPHHVGLLALQQQQQQQQETQQQIDLLLKQAEQHRQAHRLTEPVGNNAYELYQRILQLQPRHTEALTGIQRLADHYEQLARQENRIARRRTLIDKGLALVPNHMGLQQLQQQLSAPPPPPQNPPPPAVTAPVETPPPAPAVVDIEKPPAPQLTPQQQWIQELIQQGNQAFALGQYDIATERYQQILRLDPQQPAVSRKLTRIVQYYQQQAELAKEQRRWQEGLNWIHKGLSIQPNHTGLLTLRVELEAGLKPNDPPPKSVIFTPTF